MFNGCLGALDSNDMDDVVDHEYDTLLPSTFDARKATPGKLKNIHDQLLQLTVSCFIAIFDKIQFLKTPYGVAETAGARVSSI